MTNKNIFYRPLVIYITILMFAISSCKKFVEIPVPKNQIISENAFADDATATATITGIYSEMMNNAQLFSSGQTTVLAGLSADELYYYSPGYRDEFSSNQLSVANHTYLSNNFWQPAYRFIYAANLSIRGLKKSTTLTPSVKSTLTGEAKFIRAFCFFHLVNLFGDVPLILSEDYRVNASLPRAAKVSVYEQIIKDLTEAEQQLSATYPSSEKARPNKWTAAAMLARVYLYTQQWDKAETAATSVISSGEYNLVTNLNGVFLKGSSETIWQLMPVNPIVNTWEGNSILPALSSTQPTYLLTSDLLNAFEPGDQRRNTWVSSRTYLSQILYYPTKYKVYGNSAAWTEYYVVIRLAEQYLIRSEARANQNDIAGSVSDLNIIRNRSSLQNSNANSQLSLLKAIEQERRIELLSEWGHRWYDLKRTGRSDAILGALKPSVWQSTDMLWPVPNDQILLNGMLTQNPGY